MRTLAFAYACEPDEGSEPGAGWTWARMLAHVGDTWVITRANNREAIEPRLQDLAERERLHFVYVDLPPWARFWKRKKRGIRLYYLLWQGAALRAARRLHKESPFTVVWHLTFANAWLGSLAPLVGPTFVYGPVGGGIGMAPFRLFPTLGVRGSLYELVRSAARGLGRYLNPVARLAWNRAELILVQNPETRGWLPARHRAKAHVFPNAVLDVRVLFAPREHAVATTALFVARLIPWKGAVLAIRTIAQAPGWRLLVCGSGTDEARLRGLAVRLGVETRVLFLGERSREDVLRLMTEEADVFLFPSLHDEAGWVVVEALLCGLPVVCLDRGGPPALAASAALVAPARGDADAVASALAIALAEARKSVTIRDRALEFSFASRLEQLKLLLSTSGLEIDATRFPGAVDSRGEPIPWSQSTERRKTS
jgi:glycosyltransferase involved in cell wall biosynthesis